MYLKKIILVMAMTLACFSAYAEDANCKQRNKALAQNILDQAAVSIGHKSGEVTPSPDKFVGGERHEFYGEIYKGSYMIIVKTDSHCFPKEVELVDLALVQ